MLQSSICIINSLTGRYRKNSAYKNPVAQNDTTGPVFKFTYTNEELKRIQSAERFLFEARSGSEGVAALRRDSGDTASGENIRRGDAFKL